MTIEVRQGLFIGRPERVGADLVRIFMPLERAPMAWSRHLQPSLNDTHCRRVYEQGFITVANGDRVR
jgi:hypothetical protein